MRGRLPFSSNSISITRWWWWSTAVMMWSIRLQSESTYLCRVRDGSVYCRIIVCVYTVRLENETAWSLDAPLDHHTFWMRKYHENMTGHLWWEFCRNQLGIGVAGLFFFSFFYGNRYNTGRYIIIICILLPIVFFFLFCRSYFSDFSSQPNDGIITKYLTIIVLNYWIGHL